jgi:hypothetical protein
MWGTRKFVGLGRTDNGNSSGKGNSRSLRDDKQKDKHGNGKGNFGSWPAQVIIAMKRE